ncbi:MAG TPA: hypothetical protein VF621_12215 [Pyrinomonadaceae bacterium]
MFRRALAVMISGILWSSAVGYQPALAQMTEVTRAAGETRAAVQRLGAGSKKRVEVRLQDGARLKGYVSAAGEDAFTLTDSKTGQARTLAYADVSRVKKAGGGLSTRAWVIIGAAAVTAVVVGVTVIEPVLCDGGAGC